MFGPECLGPLTEAHLVSAGFGGPPTCGLPEATGSGACLGAGLSAVCLGRAGALGPAGGLPGTCLPEGEANPFDYLELLS